MIYHVQLRFDIYFMNTMYELRLSVCDIYNLRNSQYLYVGTFTNENDVVEDYK